ncbi:class I SAM-dependent methyltransferase [Candidatus Gracilibacteria bacterium]|nr:class I SAM-dependent methyltransferase [Candidatus Gracilibacteria bacterium]
MSIYDPFAHYYDADFLDHLDDLLFYRELGRRSGGPLLELMCGSGRVLVPLAEDGFTITGVDISPAMLARARARIKDAALAERATLIEGDVATVALPEAHFALAFVAINSFMHLDAVKDQLAVLENARRALKRKGSLVLDLFNPDPLAIAREDNHLSLDRSYQLDGKQVQKFVAIDSDMASQISRVTYLYDEIDAQGMLSRRTMQFNMRWFYRYELEHLLSRAGFSVRAVYGSYDLDEYNSSSPRLIVVAAPVKGRFF